MAKSILSYGNEGLWVPDLYLETLYCLLLFKLEKEDTDTYVKDLKESLIHGISGYYSGAIDLDLDSILSNQEDIMQFEKMLKQVKKLLEGDYIDNKYMIDKTNEVRNKYYTDENDYFNNKYFAEKERIVLLINYILRLIYNQLGITPKDPVNYWEW